jgi:protein gp37
MADLFGEWVPDEWIKTVLDACKKAPQHRYLFLTKNFKRYEYLINKKILPARINQNYMFGHTISTKKDADDYFDWHFKSYHDFKANYWIHRFISVEPLYDQVNLRFRYFGADWVIIGAETGNRKGKVIPKKEWIKNIVWQCQTTPRTIPVFMKNSLIKIWGEPLIREYPWENEKSNTEAQQ